MGQKPVGLETRPPPRERSATDTGEAAAHAPEPPIDKADDLDAIKSAVDDAASVGGGLWLSYVIAFVYLAVAAGAVTHKDLFFENPVKLPFFNVELPLVAFFFLAPILFIIVHAYTLVHLVFLTEKAKRYHQALYDPRRKVDSAARQNLQWQLPSNIFIQFLAGPSSLRRGPFGWLLRAIAWVTLAIAPILLLLMMQVQFLPFHSSFITWTQRIALVVDLILVWWLWGKILAGREVDEREQARSEGTAICLVLSVFVVLFSWTAATFPGEWQEEHWPDGRPFLTTDEFGEPKEVSLHDWVFNSKVDDASRRRWLPFSSTLVLAGLNIYEGLGIDDPEKAKWHDFVFRARGRDLRGAIFDLASLPKVDFEAADLQGASLATAQLQGASFEQAQLQGATFFGAQLQGATLDGAELKGATLDGAELKGATLDGGELQGASLKDAQLYGASLVSAELQGATLFGAKLQGASLDRAQLQGAWLDHAQLQGASLVEAQLQSASLYRSQLQGTSLEGAVLDVTDLSGAYLWRATLSSKVSAILTLAGATWSPSWQNERWRDQPWNEMAYHGLRREMESLQSGDLRDEAIDRIRRLDCADPDQTLASCDRSADPPPEAVAWRKALEAASVDEDTYRAALVRALSGLLCPGGRDTIHVVRSDGFQTRLEAAGRAASGLIDDVMNKDSKDCPVATALTDADRAKLLQVKQAIEKAPTPASATAYSP